MKTINKLADLRCDPNNANKGTKRGLELLERSLERCGIGRSVLVDRNGILIAGNKATERIADLTSGDVEIVTVRTTGRQLVVVQREDLDLLDPTDGRARELAIADNRVAEVDLEWDANVLLHHMPAVDVGGYFFDQELARLFGEADAKGELGTPRSTAAAAADPVVEPDAAAAATHDPADEDQTICPECGHRF